MTSNLQIYLNGHLNTCGTPLRLYLGVVPAGPLHMQSEQAGLDAAGASLGLDPAAGAVSAIAAKDAMPPPPPRQPSTTVVAAGATIDWSSLTLGRLSLRSLSAPALSRLIARAQKLDLAE